jgi:hypothetical protein
MVARPRKTIARARPYVGMSKVVIDMTMSPDGFVAGPHDGKDHLLGTHGGAHLFDWYFSGREEFRHPLFRPEPGANRDEVARMVDAYQEPCRSRVQGCLVTAVCRSLWPIRRDPPGNWRESITWSSA